MDELGGRLNPLELDLPPTPIYFKYLKYTSAIQVLLIIVA